MEKVPSRYGSVTPYLVVDGAAGLLGFLAKVFDGKEEGDRMTGPDGKIAHSEIDVGGRIVMAMDAREDGPMPAMLNVYVEDCDAVFQKAMDAGATEVRPLETQFYGDRSGAVRDAWGNVWWISTHMEDVDPEDMARRVQEFTAQQQGEQPGT